MTTIDSLQIEIQDNSEKAVSGLEKLTNVLNSLRAATHGGVGLTKIGSDIKK